MLIARGAHVDHTVEGTTGERFSEIRAPELDGVTEGFKLSDRGRFDGYEVASLDLA